jgi:hypothetical protein
LYSMEPVGLTRLKGPCYTWKFPEVPVSSRGQDTWFSATGPGFESPYRYHPSLAETVSELRMASQRAHAANMRRMSTEARGDAGERRWTAAFPVASDGPPPVRREICRVA